MEELIKAILLGLIQGLTEFLPISSTGHLLIGRKLFGLSEAGLFLDTMLHFGTFISIVIVFWDQIKDLLKHPLTKMGRLLIVGTIPTAVIGLVFEDFFEAISKTGSTVGWEFLITGTILWIADNKKKEGYKNIDKISYKDALLIGTLQGMAIFPALSRSGLTIAGALFRKIDKKEAATYSFLLSLPAILGGVFLQGMNIFSGEKLLALKTVGIIPLINGTLAAAIAGYIAVKWMLNVIKSGSLKIFSLYVWVVGFGIIAFQVMGKW